MLWIFDKSHKFDDRIESRLQNNIYILWFLTQLTCNEFLQFVFSELIANVTLIVTLWYYHKAIKDINFIDWAIEREDHTHDKRDFHNRKISSSCSTARVLLHPFFV